MAVSQTNVHVIKSKPSNSARGGGKVNVLLATCETGKCASNVMKKAKSEKGRGDTLYATAEPPSSPHPTASLSPSMPLKVLPLPAYLIESGSISLASCCNPPVGGAKLSLAVLNATAWHHRAAAENWHAHTHTPSLSIPDTEESQHTHRRTLHLQTNTQKKTKVKTERK